MSLCSDAPEDEVISLFAGLLPNPDVPLSLESGLKNLYERQGMMEETESIGETRRLRCRLFTLLFL